MFDTQTWGPELNSKTPVSGLFVLFLEPSMEANACNLSARETWLDGQPIHLISQASSVSPRSKRWLVEKMVNVLSTCTWGCLMDSTCIYTHIYVHMHTNIRALTWTLIHADWFIELNRVVHVHSDSTRETEAGQLPWIQTWQWLHSAFQFNLDRIQRESVKPISTNQTIKS